MDHITALHKTLRQHKLAFRELPPPFTLHFHFPGSLPPLGRYTLVPLAFSTSVAMETRLLVFPLPSYQVQLLDSVPRPPLYTLSILLMFRQIWWKMLFTFFPHSTIAVCLVQHISVGSIHFLKEIITLLPCPL